jgi:soluble lytic murein transglycosylase-like protein
MAKTWELYYKKFRYRPADFYNWRCNYRVAVAHLAELLRQHNGNITTAIGEYNGGGRWVKIAASQNHVRKFMIANRGITRLRGRRENQ